MTNAEARFNKSLRPRKPEGSLGRTAQDVHLDSHTAPELCVAAQTGREREIPLCCRCLVSFFFFFFRFGLLVWSVGWLFWLLLGICLFVVVGGCF